MTDVTMHAAAVEPVAEDAVDEQLVRQLGQRARAEGLQLTGEGGLLQRQVTVAGLREPRARGLISSEELQELLVAVAATR